MPLAQNNVQTVAITVRYQNIVLSHAKIKHCKSQLLYPGRVVS